MSEPLCKCGHYAHEHAGPLDDGECLGNDLACPCAKFDHATTPTTDDRAWLWLPQFIPDQWTTPHITVAFGRYWKVYLGLGPFYLTVGYVQMF